MVERLCADQRLEGGRTRERGGKVDDDEQRESESKGDVKQRGCVVDEARSRLCCRQHEPIVSNPSFTVLAGVHESLKVGKYRCRVGSLPL